MDINGFFFGNALDSSIRINDLEQFRMHLGGYLKREEEYFREEAHPDLEREFHPLFSATFPPILHSSLVVSSVMLIELELKAIADSLRTNLSLPLSMNDLQRSLLERFRKYVSALAAIDIQFCSDQWADVVGIFEIRNCLVHNYGSLDRFSRRSVVEEFHRRNGVPTIMEDVINVDDSTSEKVLRVASVFFDSIYEAVLRRFPGQHRWPPCAGWKS